MLVIIKKSIEYLSANVIRPPLVDFAREAVYMFIINACGLVKFHVFPSTCLHFFHVRNVDINAFEII